MMAMRYPTVVNLEATASAWKLVDVNYLIDKLFYRGLSLHRQSNCRRNSASIHVLARIYNSHKVSLLHHQEDSRRIQAQTIPS